MLKQDGFIFFLQGQVDMSTTTPRLAAPGSAAAAKDGEQEAASAAAR